MHLNMKCFFLVNDEQFRKLFVPSESIWICLDSGKCVKWGLSARFGQEENTMNTLNVCHSLYTREA